MTAITERVAHVHGVSLAHTHTEFASDYSEQWRDYDVTLTLRGRDYRLGTLTVYQDGRALLTRHHTLNLKTIYKAYRAVAHVLGAPLSGDYADHLTFFDS